MRRLAICALTMAAALAAPALAQSGRTWSHPEGLFSVLQPEGWPAPEDMTQGGVTTQYVLGAADYECWITIVDRLDDPGATAERVNKAMSQPIGAEKWETLTKGHHFFQGQARHIASEVEASGAFPVQFATIETPRVGTAVAGIQARPGWEAWAFCGSYDGVDRAEAFRAVARSLASGKDAELIAQLEAAAAAAAPAAPAGGKPE